MTTSEPFNAAMREMNSIMDEIERIYAKGTVQVSSARGGGGRKARGLDLRRPEATRVDHGAAGDAGVGGARARARTRIRASCTWRASPRRSSRRCARSRGSPTSRTS